MSEQKRVPLQSLGTTKKEKKGEDFVPSYRFVLTLPESNEKACPEFNYRELLKSEEKKRKKENKRKDENATNGLDPYDDDDEDKLKEMAKHFEAKYGTVPANKIKRSKYDEYVDLGAGYDESDSFIDNTDAYDEIVPEELTTVHGGFYINCGALEYKSSEGNSLIGNNNNNNNVEEDSTESSEEEPEKEDSPSRPQKRPLSTSEDEEPEEVDNNSVHAFKKAKLDDNADIGERNVSNEAALKKKKKQEVLLRRKNTVARDLLKVRREGRDTEVQDEAEDKKKPEKVEGQKSKALLEKKFDIKRFEKKPSSNGLEMKKLEGKKGTGKDACYDDAIESVVNAARFEDESSLDTMDSGRSRGIACSDSECDETMDKEEAPLPETLTEDMKELINKLKQHAVTSKEGKTKFFNGPINVGLLSLEKKLRMRCSASERLQVYTHLAHFLPCSKPTLVNRAKKLYLQDVEDKVKELLERLKAAIDRIMPSALSKYTRDCQRVADENPQLYWEMYRYCCVTSDDPCSRGIEGSPSDAESSEGDENASKSLDKAKIPRRKFPWTEETKRLVLEIASARREYFEILKRRKGTVETFVSTFMDAEVRLLWPPGWVRLETLVKYSCAQPPVKRKLKKLKENPPPGVCVSTTAVTNSTGKTDSSSALLTTNSVPPIQERVKTPTNLSKNPENPVDFSTGMQVSKSSESLILQNNQSEKKSSSKNRDNIKNRESPVTLSHSNSTTSSVVNSSGARISVVPTSQLMGTKGKTVSQSEKFNPMDLTSGSLSITPVNDFHKLKINETKISEVHDSISITPCLDVPSDSVSISHSTIGQNFSGSQTASSYAANSISKAMPSKHRVVQETSDVKDERATDRECIDSQKTDRKEKKEKRTVENKSHKSHDSKKRKKEHNKAQELVDPVKIEPLPVSLSKEEQEQRQIEETMAATNFLSQIINSNDTPRLMSDKRKEVLDETSGTVVQPTEQENDVQMVMRSLKELQELQEMKYSPSHSPVSVIQKPSKSSSNVQYVNYQEDYQHLYHKKEEKLRVPKKEDAQW